MTVHEFCKLVVKGCDGRVDLKQVKIVFSTVDRLLHGSLSHLVYRALKIVDKKSK